MRADYVAANESAEAIAAYDRWFAVGANNAVSPPSGSTSTGSPNFAR
jgi:hypothetical protein